VDLRLTSAPPRPPAPPRRDPTQRLLHLGAGALPICVLALWAWWSWQAALARAGDDAQRYAALVREYAQRVVQTQERTLEAAAALLAVMPADAPPDVVGRHLSRLVAGRGAPLSIAVIDPAGRMTVATGDAPIGLSVMDRPYFAPLRAAPPGAIRLERQVLRPNGQDALVVAQRRPGEAFAGLLLATVPVRAFTDFFGTLAGDPRAAASLMRADGALLVRHRPELTAAILPPDAPAMRAIAGGGGVFRVVAGTDNVDRLYAITQVEGHPLYASFGIAVDSLRSAWLHDMAPIAALLLLASVLGYTAVDRGLRALAAEDERRRADAATREARRMAELQETLLRELHHRVKNSMATVLALTRLRPADAQHADRVLEQRVFALAKVHDLLHVAAFHSRLDVAAFLRALCASPAIVPPERGIPVLVRAEPVEVEVERATPLALIATELVGNALRHAFPHGRRGRVEVELRAPAAPDGPARLTVRDNGIGLLEGTLAAGRHSGLGLVQRLATQLGGSLEMRGAEGAEISLSFRPAPPT
jgi:two-component sensor histidine kinase